MQKISQWARVALASLLVAGTASALANEAYPVRPITLVVPFAAGGMTDVLARQLGRTMGDALKQPVIVDNRVGAGGIIGADRVAKSKPDGYTLLITTTAHVVNPAITKQLPYDTEKDFQPIAMLARTPNVLVVNPSLPVHNVQELIAYAKKTGGVSYGSSGAGGTTHLSGELLAARTGAPFIHVPYKGTALAVNDLLGGQIQASFVDALTAVKYIESKRLRAIGVSTLQRNIALPDVPTIAEQGVPGYETEIWIGFYAPRGTPPAIVEQLNRLALKAMTEPQFQDMMGKQGTQPGQMGVGDFSAYVAQETAKWRTLVQNAGIAPQ